MEIGCNDDLLTPDEYLVHEVLEELVAGLGCVNGRLGEPFVERADGSLVLVERGLHMLGLDHGVKLMLLLFQGAHGFGGGLVEDALGDGLDEVGELLFRVCAPSFQCLEDFISTSVGLPVMIG
ncbi:hypothetical protein [Bifidobacterium dentium]|uniref:hypothetical protein n=1 Tax=Bifidobacterium dentium TaxID=1689 RepID=UPI001AD9E2CF|nr:hypothetical protein [Bifidobacterium dentium]MCK6132614.1 hypothetical protein [Bifidobacterium dentium]QTL77866.1 hypothetical protein J7M35_00155 [Bifidobacterium dentium]